MNWPIPRGHAHELANLNSTVPLERDQTRKLWGKMKESISEEVLRNHSNGTLNFVLSYDEIETSLLLELTQFSSPFSPTVLALPLHFSFSMGNKKALWERGTLRSREIQVAVTNFPRSCPPSHYHRCFRTCLIQERLSQFRLISLAIVNIVAPIRLRVSYYYNTENRKQSPDRVKLSLIVWWSLTFYRVAKI